MKNVIAMKMIKQQSKSMSFSIKDSIQKMIKVVGQKTKLNQLKNMNSCDIELTDGLMDRVNMKIDETQRKIDLQNKTINRIQSNIELL